MKLRARLTVTTDEAALAAAACGLGVVRVLSYQAAGLLAEGQLRIVLNEHGQAARPVYVLRRERNRDAPKVSQFLQLLVERLVTDANLQR